MHEAPLFYFVGFFMLATICFSSCGKSEQQQNLTSGLSHAALSHTDAVLLEHTRHADIPVPVGFKPQIPKKSFSTQASTNALWYAGSLTVNQSIDFYKQAMELSGWEIQDFSIDSEGLLFCYKTNKRCALSIRSSRHKTHVCIFIQNNNQQQAANAPQDTINTKTVNI